MQHVIDLALQGNEKVDDTVLPHLAQVPKLKHVAASSTGITARGAKAHPSPEISALKRA